MPGTFAVEWLPGGILLQRRTGVLTVDQANEYAAAVELALASRPSPWGAVVDGRGASAQIDEVQTVIQSLIHFVMSRDVRRVAMVSTSVVTGLQQRRITLGPGLHDASTVGFFTDFDEAVADVRSALAG
jgi:hypothetical protein